MWCLKGLYCSLEMAGLGCFSLFIFPKCKVFQSSASKFSKVVDDSLGVFHSQQCSSALVWGGYWCSCKCRWSLPLLWWLHQNFASTVEKYCRTFVVFPWGWCAFPPRKTLLLPQLGCPIVLLRPTQATQTKTKMKHWKFHSFWMLLEISPEDIVEDRGKTNCFQK